MQQQIYIDRQEQQLPEIDQISASPTPRPLEELISQHYDQDFDSISDIASVPNSQIIEEVSQCIENSPLEKLNTHCIEAENIDQETMKLKQECLVLKSQIQVMQQQLAEKEKAFERQPDQLQKQSDSYQWLVQEKQNNQQQLASQKQQLQTVLIGLLGKDSLSTELILAQIDFGQDTVIQERLLEEGVRLNALLHCTLSQIGKLKREVDKNGYQLSVMEQARQQMTVKHHSLFRQIEEKKQKFSKNEAKIGQMNVKVEELDLKLAKLQVTPSEDVGKGRLKQRWQVQMSQKERTSKKIKMVNHNLQQSITALKRNISDLKKQQRQLDQSQHELSKINLRIEEESNKKLEQFDKLTKKIDRRRAKYKVNHFLTQEEQLSFSNKKSYQSANNDLQLKPNSLTYNRKSIQEDSASKIASSELEDDLKKLSETALDADQSEKDIITEIQTKLKECSTDGTLRKQFKLKLPNKTPTASNKYLDLSQVNSTKPVPHTKLYERNSQIAKLSVTERLQRIEQMQKEDRRYSIKLQNEKQRKIDRQSRRFLKDLIDSSQFSHERKENQMRSSSCYRNDQLPAEPSIRLSHSVAVSSKNIEAQAATPFKAAAKLEMDVDARLPLLAARPQSTLKSSNNDLKAESSKSNTQRINMKQKIANVSLDKNLNLQNLLNPKILFSSIQQKLLMRQSSACETFNLSQNNSVKQQEALNATVLESTLGGLSRISRQSSMVRRRGEKKISDQYMRVLEQRGRRILQLDNEGD